MTKANSSMALVLYCSAAATKGLNYTLNFVRADPPPIIELVIDN
jgi:hypothetical protein